MKRSFRTAFLIALIAIITVVLSACTDSMKKEPEKPAPEIVAAPPAAVVAAEAEAEIEKVQVQVQVTATGEILLPPLP